MTRRGGRPASWRRGHTATGHPCCAACGIRRERADVCPTCVKSARMILALGLWEAGDPKRDAEWRRAWRPAVDAALREGRNGEHA